MSFVSKARSIYTVVTNPSLAFTSSSNYLFIISHMRSRSSALAHVLGSNQEVCGYSELGLSYRRQMDLVRMRLKLHNDLGCSLRGKYLLDKILHNYFELSEPILEATGAKVIFLLRDPESTIASIWEGQTARREAGESPVGTPEDWSRYYCDRLRYMQELGEKTRGHCFFVDADDLVNGTDSVLHRLTSWLDLQDPLVPEYSLFPNTGKLGHGDWSDNIRSGKLAKTEGRPAVRVSGEASRELAHCYQRCRETLLEVSVQ